MLLTKANISDTSSQPLLDSPCQRGTQGTASEDVGYSVTFARKLFVTMVFQSNLTRFSPGAGFDDFLFFVDCNAGGFVSDGRGDNVGEV